MCRSVQCGGVVVFAQVFVYKRRLSINYIKRSYFIEYKVEAYINVQVSFLRQPLFDKHLATVSLTNWYV